MVLDLWEWTINGWFCCLKTSLPFQVQHKSRRDLKTKWEPVWVDNDKHIKITNFMQKLKLLYYFGLGGLMTLRKLESFHQINFILFSPCQDPKSIPNMICFSMSKYVFIASCNQILRSRQNLYLAKNSVLQCRFTIEYYFLLCTGLNISNAIREPIGSCS